MVAGLGAHKTHLAAIRAASALHIPCFRAQLHLCLATPFTEKNLSQHLAVLIMPLSCDQNDNDHCPLTQRRELLYVLTVR